MTIEPKIDVVDLSEWSKQNSSTPIPSASDYVLRLWAGADFDEKRTLSDPNPTGRQILEIFNRFPSDEHILLMLTRDGELETVELGETVNLQEKGPERFFAFLSDRQYNVSIDDRRFPWGESEISGEMLRFIGRTPNNRDLYLEHDDKADELLETSSKVDLSKKGVEHIRSKLRQWKINVQGMIVTFTTPIISAKDALKEAGFDTNKGWNIILKVRGEPKRALEISDEIDLTTPGIEKLRLSPKVINNGEAPTQLRHDFPLLPKDEAYLSQRELNWQTLIDGKRRWLLIKDFPVSNGLSHKLVDIAIDVPATYPQAEIDMFFCYPHLSKSNGSEIAQTSGRTPIYGRQFQQWSRHLNGSTRWNPSTDSVMSHIALIEDASLREAPDDEI
jgi:hypothetical protein